MGEAAVELARACAYQGVGTVEFIVTSEGEFFFLEMNARLQVEHPVTELVWGIDLVEQQLRVAAGEPLALVEQPPAPAGHAIEARIYAEDPAAGFLPAVGTVRRWRRPRGVGVRVVGAIEEGREVGTEYDPLLAKVVAHGPDRATALGRLDRALGELELLGVASNAAFARRLLALPDVVAGRLDTGLLERALEQLEPELGAPIDLWAAAAAAIYLADTEGSGIPPGPWRRRLEGGGEWRIEDGELRSGDDSWNLDARRLPDGGLLVELDGVARSYAVALGERGDRVWVGRDGHQLEARVESRRRAGAETDAGSLEAPMPGKVLAVEVADGARVGSGDVLVVLESMKMELQITAPTAGIVSGLAVEVGDRVGQGQALASIRAERQGEAPQ
jgi:acetyl-CoA/propionyl-CoA carboxylase biotin carboxyl carrier protein